jgi:hypothetical protein
LQECLEEESPVKEQFVFDSPFLRLFSIEVNEPMLENIEPIEKCTLKLLESSTVVARVG